MSRTGGSAVALDTAVMVVASIGICVAAQDLAFMRVGMPLLLGLRLGLWACLPRRQRDTGALAEVGLFGVCVLIGAVNDWLSVSHFQIYDYRVPTDLPGLSDIPSWMLLYWGMILRYPLTLAHWRRLALPAPGQALYIGGRAAGGVTARLAVLFALVLVTRQLEYRYFLHPIWSWVPMAVALATILVALRPDRRRLAFGALVLLVGPALEVLYIQVGGLHVYGLGWLWGVPIWIVLWWVVAIFTWEEVTSRIIGLFDVSAAFNRLDPGAPRLYP